MRRSSHHQARKAAAAAADGDDADANSIHPDRYSIISPTYNEAENVPYLTALIDETCTAAGLDYEIVFVDDGSPDGTADVVRALQRVFGGDRVRLVTRPRKLGLGSAYAAGLAAATGGWVVLMDADLSHDPRALPRFVAAAAAAAAAARSGRGGGGGSSGGSSSATTAIDIVAGSRYLPGGGVAGWGLGRRLTSRGANVLARTLLGLGPSDLTGAYRLYRRGALARLLPQCKCTGYAFQMEVLARAAASGLRVAEVPIVFVDRVYGASKLGPSEFGQFLVGLATLLLEL